MKCTKLRVPNCSDNQGRSHACEAAEKKKEKRSQNLIWNNNYITIQEDSYISPYLQETFPSNKYMEGF